MVRVVLGSVDEAFDVDVDLRHTPGPCGCLDEVHPLRVSADVDVVIGQVGHEVAQCVDVRQVAGLLTNMAR